METALGAANWVLGNVLKKLSDDLVAAYVASSELGLNFTRIRTELSYTLGLLHAAQGRDAVCYNPGLQRLLEDLNRIADEAEDALDELHYFMIQDELDGTREATSEVGGGLSGHARHGRHAVRHTVGNWLPCFSCSRTQDNAYNKTNDGRVGALQFDRVAMAKRIKSLIEDIQTLCAPVSNLLQINHSSYPTATKAASLKRPNTSSTITQDKLYGRGTIFEQTIFDMTDGAYRSEVLSVLAVVGPGGIGKTTFTQHLYNDKRIEEHFSVRVWVCVSTNFDVVKLTQEILKCILAVENEESSRAHETTNLDQLQKYVAQRLKSKRFLVVLDDIWKCNSESEWKNLLSPFTKGETKGNMVLVTTRFPNIAQVVKKTNPIKLQGLEPDEFWEFFQACIFGDTDVELEQHDLIDTAKDIAKKLKCSPLAAKTVGRLLKNNLSREHWVEVLERKEWENQKNEDDIMPALKISYDYLPFHLKKCFSYCALFPEDHIFDGLEITRLWIAIGITDSSGENREVNNTRSRYLDELVDVGFLMKGDDNLHQHYVMHDLLHELSQVVSSEECMNISGSCFRADGIPPSIRHLSINIEGKLNEYYERELDKLKERIYVRNLRTLMFFGEYNRGIISILNETFKEMKSLRVLFIYVDSIESLPCHFSKLIHLRYLKIRSPLLLEPSLPSALSRFYHMKFLDLTHWGGGYGVPSDISRLVNLRHFLAQKELHCNIPEIGNMKYLQELKEFIVKKRIVGFELRELGKLRELGGTLTIRNLENVGNKDEAHEAKLVLKRNLVSLRLVWGQQTVASDVVDGLQPHPNLRALSIINHGGTIGPSWLCTDVCFEKLEFLHLEGVSWNTLPPFGMIPYLTELKLKKIAGMHQFGPDYGGVKDKCFTHLKKIVLSNMPGLLEWVAEADCQSFPRLEIIECIDCCNLSTLPTSECPSLCVLQIFGCPKLSLRLIPCTSKTTYIHVVKEFSDKLIHYEKNELNVNGYYGALDFDNMDKVKKISIRDVIQTSRTELQMQNSLRGSCAEECDSMSSEEYYSDTCLTSEFGDSVRSITHGRISLNEFRLCGESLSRALNCFPALSELEISYSVKYNREHKRVPYFVGTEYHEQGVQFLSSSSLQKLKVSNCGNLTLPVDNRGGLLGLTSLESLTIENCGEMLCQWSMGEEIMKPFPTSLRELTIIGESSKLAMSLLSNLTSLTHLELVDCENLTKDGFNPHIVFGLKKLVIYNVSKWTRSGNHVHFGIVENHRDPTAGDYNENREENDCDSVTESHNTVVLGDNTEANDCDSVTESHLSVVLGDNTEEKIPCSVAADLLVEVARMVNEMSAGSFYQLEHLEVDTISAVLVAPICSRLATTLHTLSFRRDRWVEKFTEEQEQALELLTSLQKLTFEGCYGLQTLPEGLHRLRSLEELVIVDCTLELFVQGKELKARHPGLLVTMW
ncbi:putative disease resistance protein RGA4 [Panicum miliaceum]|uniref:Disease resistance protein RGA4 n=1 Tax=Panicum miliaceum TaxID=4540 RepID=A0A3L6RTY0_PANMI|nr:putative disease resistance protein RGA4 [Panicum miliaceum]